MLKLLRKKKNTQNTACLRVCRGWICGERNINGCWLVNFPQCGEKADIAEIPVKEEDLKLIDIMHAKINE